MPGDQTPHTPYQAAPVLPAGDSPWPLETLRRLARNPIEAWPDAVYAEDVVTTHMLGHTVHFVCSPPVIRALFVEQAAAMAREEGLRRALSGALGNGILLAEGAAWRWQRLTVGPAFRHAKIETYLPAVIAVAEAATLRWWTLPDGASIDLLEELKRLSLEIMAATLLAGDATVDAPALGAALNDSVQPAPWAMLLSLLGAPKWLPYPGQRRARRGCDAMRTAMRALARRRRVRHTDGQPEDDLLTLLLDSIIPGCQRRMNDEELTDSLLTFIATGHETVALALFWLFQLLEDAPAVEAAMLREIASVTGGERLQPAMIGQLFYTGQVVSETLRLYPPVPATLRKMQNDAHIGGHHFARGTRVVLPIFAVHRHAALWARPNDFDPDRFSAEAAAGRDRYAFIPFGLGPRHCIGMGFAMAELIATVAVLLPKFHIRRAGGLPAARQHITLRPDGDTRAILAPRRPPE